jgi:hypothetical protein
LLSDFSLHLPQPQAPLRPTVNRLDDILPPALLRLHDREGDRHASSTLTDPSWQPEGQHTLAGDDLPLARSIPRKGAGLLGPATLTLGTALASHRAAPLMLTTV